MSAALQIVTILFSSEFKKSKVAVSDGIEEAGLVCVLSGVLSEDMKKDVSSFWTVGGEKKPIAPIVSGIAPKVSGIAPKVSVIAPKVSGIAPIVPV